MTGSLSERIQAAHTCSTFRCTREPQPGYGLCDPCLTDFVRTGRAPLIPARDEPEWVSRAREGRLVAKEL